MNALIVAPSGTTNPALDVTGGSIFERPGDFLLSGYARVRGGEWSFDNAFVNVNQNGLLEFVGASFELDGVPITGLEPGEGFEVSARNSTLSGVLQDGSPFSITLVEKSDADVGSAGVDPLGAIVVTLAVPEPGSITLTTFVLTTGVVRRRGRALRNDQGRSRQT